MKRKPVRSVLWLLCAVLLCACQPTPEVEYVVNKADNLAGQRIQTTNNEPAQIFPDRWDEAEPWQCGRFAVSVHADVVQKGDGQYPVYRTRESTFSKESAAGLLTTLLGKPTSRSSYEPTKADWQREFQAWLDDYEAAEAERARDGMPASSAEPIRREEYESQAAWYQERIAAAPDELTAEPVRDFSDVRTDGYADVYTLESGESASVAVVCDGVPCLRVSRGTQTGGELLSDRMYAEEVRMGFLPDGLWQPPALECADAEAMLLRQMDRLNLAGFTIEFAVPANLFDRLEQRMTVVASGWMFRLVRDFGGYPPSPPNVTPSASLQYGTADVYAANALIPKETVTVLIDGTGVRYFCYEAPKEVLRLETANVPLLSFEEVQMRVKNAFTACLAGSWYEADGTAPNEIELYRLLLTTYTLHVRDSEDYYEMPCWLVYFDFPALHRKQRGNPLFTPNVLILNAVDGSVISVDY